MALIATEPLGKKPAMRFEIESETKRLLKLYTEFSGNARPDPVINGALKLLFKSDPDFGPWLEQRKHHDSAASNPAGSRLQDSDTPHH